MKMMYNGTEIKSLNIKHYEMDTNSATVQPSDLQAGVTCFGRGKKITGTGKCFEFAFYGQMESNDSLIIPCEVNVVQVATVDYPMSSTTPITKTKNLDFTTPQTVGNVVINNVTCPVNITVQNNEISISCGEAVTFEVFFGKDNYV